MQSVEHFAAVIKDPFTLSNLGNSSRDPGVVGVRRWTDCDVRGGRLRAAF